MNIGFIGIGAMGRWMAERLLDADYCLTVYDKNPNAGNVLQDKGAVVVSSIQELGKKCEVVITMLPNSQIVESVIEGEDGLVTSMKPGGLIIDMSSSYVLSTKELAKRVGNAGLTLIDAPVSGGVKGAKAGTLTIMVGGTDEDYSRIFPILKCLGKNIKLIGETGSGHALKALNNYLSAASLYATTEAMVLAKKLGIDLEIALEAINQSSGQSFSTHYKFPSFVLPRSFNSGFSLDLLLKDVKMVTLMAKETRLPILLASTVEQIYQTASNMGEENQDHTEIVKLLEKLSNCSLEEQKETLI